ncbi:MCP four helix bundle domain-containing protein, partial [Ramlibacter sp.]|uniref:MCP four helix bundle domain-containing protein n=1 Tax=Ramlibacter sp. TaxID=1917967 RepID=UPI002BF8DC61
MFKNIKVSTRLLAGFLLVAVLGAAVAAVGIYSMARIDDNADRIYQRELLGVSYVKEANIDLMYMARDLRNMLLAFNLAERRKAADAVEKDRQLVKANLDKARPLFSTEEGKRKLAEFDRAFAEYDATAREIVKKAMTEEMQDARPTVQFLFESVVPKMQAADDRMSELSDGKEKTAASVAADSSETYRFSRALMIGLTLASGLAGLAIGVLVTRSVTRPLADAVKVAEAVAGGDLTTEVRVHSTDETGQLMQALKSMNDSLARVVGQVRAGTDTIATASGQIATGNQDLSQRTEEQASSLEETAASMEELTGTVKQNADNARQANQLAQSSSEVARKGGAVVEQVVETMDAINASSR